MNRKLANAKTEKRIVCVLDKPVFWRIRAIIGRGLWGQDKDSVLAFLRLIQLYQPGVF